MTWDPLHCLRVLKIPDVTVRHSFIASLEMKLHRSQDESSGREQSVFLTLPPETKCFKHFLMTYSNMRGDMSRIIIDMSKRFCGPANSFNSDVRSKKPHENPLKSQERSM